MGGACTCNVGWTGSFCEKRKVSSLPIDVQQLCVSFVSMCVIVCVLLSLRVACPQGFYGLDCQQKCACMNGALCSHITGECSCPSGWIGPQCNQSEHIYLENLFIQFYSCVAFCLFYLKSICLYDVNAYGLPNTIFDVTLDTQKKLNCFR